MEKSIISILGLESMPLSDQVEIVTQVMELVNKRLMLRIVKSVDAKTVDAYIKLVEESRESELPQFISAHMPDFYDILEDEVMKVKSELGEMMGRLGV